MNTVVNSFIYLSEGENMEIGTLVPTGNTVGVFTLRDYFAAFAIQGILAGDSDLKIMLGDMSEGHEPQQILAEDAYKIADAMLIARAE